MDSHSTITQAALSVSLSLAAGMVAQSIARHVKLPGIVLLLAAGVLLGPDVAGVVEPHSLGPALHILVGFAVAVILFEGGMNLNLKRLRREAGVIRRLLTVGALVTATGSALAARWILGWDWRLSILFGTLMIVTGPTVITPLLRRIKVKRNIETVLEAEGVLIDAVGAVVAAVLLQVALSPSSLGVARGPLEFASRLGFGLACGAAGGYVVSVLLKIKNVVPEGLENVFTLSLVFALFHLSNAFLEESGIMTVTIAGMVVGNLGSRVHRDLLEFKEQLTVMLIGMLFVLLAADVRVEGVRELGGKGLATVACLMFVIRPINIALSTLGSGFSAREKIFLAWLAPRGIVAAAVASLFAQSLSAAGIPGGDQFQELVFLVIAVTVLFQGLTGGLVARLLGLRRPVDQGTVIFGSNEAAHALGRLLRDAGEEVIFLDRNPATCHVVEEDGFKVIFGNAMDERTLQRARLEERAACVAATINEWANLLFIKKAAEEFKVQRAYAAVQSDDAGVNEAMVHEAEGIVLFGRARDVEAWSLRFRRKEADFEAWRLEGDPGEDPFDMPESSLLPMTVTRGDETWPANSKSPPRKGDLVTFAITRARRDESADWLAAHGYVQATDPDQ